MMLIDILIGEKKASKESVSYLIFELQMKYQRKNLVTVIEKVCHIRLYKHYTEE